MSFEREREALTYIDPHDRETWVDVGMALHDEYRDDAFDLWDEWARGADNYSPTAARATWKGYKPGGGIKLGTLFYLAAQRGWKPTGGFKPREIDPEERARRERRAREAQERDKREAQHAAERGAALWKAAQPLRPDHPQMRPRSVEPTDTLREIPAEQAAKIIGYPPKQDGAELQGRLIVAPLKGRAGYVGVELRDEGGLKTLPYGTAPQGSYWTPERLPDGDGTDIRLEIAEGVISTLSAQAATGDPCVAARTAGNLLPVAVAMREQYPKATIVVLGERGGGYEQAKRAADAAGALLATFEDDANALHNAQGLEAVRKAIDAAQAPEVSEAQLAPANRSSAFLAGDAVRVLRGDAVKIVSIGWYWFGYLPSGKVVLIGGAPGTGKTTLAITLAATITIGGRWPDGTRAEVGDVLIWSGEDSVADTLAGRFKAAGADMSRVHFVMGVDTERGGRPFDPAQDFPRLVDVAANIPDLRLIIVDPIVMAVAGDSHKNAETRRGLQPLVDFAEKSGAVVLGITHFSKGTQGREPIERITGSLAFAAVARLVLVAAKVDEANGGGRVLVRSKSNLGPDGGGFKYELEQTEIQPGVTASRVAWGESIDGTARDILATAEIVPDANEDSEETRGATEWLRAILEPGELLKTEVMRRAAEAGFAGRTIQRARQRIGAVAEVSGFGDQKRSVWKLPAPPIHATEPSFVPIVPANLSGTDGTNGGADDGAEVFD